MLSGKHEALYLGGYCCIQSTGIASVLQAHTPAVRDSNCLWSLTLILYRYAGFIAIGCKGDNNPSILLYHQRYISHLSAAICAVAPCT